MLQQDASIIGWELNCSESELNQTVRCQEIPTPSKDWTGPLLSDDLLNTKILL